MWLIYIPEVCVTELLYYWQPPLRTGSAQSAAWSVAGGQQCVREVAGRGSSPGGTGRYVTEGSSLRRRQNDQAWKGPVPKRGSEVSVSLASSKAASRKGFEE